ncbi:hypothetical protein AUJ69_02200 [Candidatus Woesearchaeota archaeon CG1_02_47_18]|nr:MAG: hypothetical protein AUJ69_02200 [Candidatus Woesearchaeota archaeon CG1_02_47_18]HII30161.1 hypothetical protein [Candidatus Woesearchaeota archaeon]
MSDNTQGDLYKELDEQKGEVLALRSRLNELDEQKEGWFEKREALSREINSLIRQVRELKKRRDAFTAEVKELKKRRTELNSSIKEKAGDIKKVRAERDELIKKLGLKKTPSQLRQDVKRLEEQVEIEVDFNKEQRIMKIIKQKKRQVSEAEKVSDVWERAGRLSAEVRKLRDEAEGVHQTIQRKAAESQRLHEQLIAKSKEIDELKKKEEDAYTKFSELKNEFMNVNDQLKSKLVKVKDVKLRIDSAASKKKAEKQAAEKKLIDEKERTVEEKIRRGTKLTTDDILIFQRREGGLPAKGAKAKESA